ncbi:MAG: hypothetical protein J5J06_12995 [Phycisphaerae bacterium]|nr:hypothetical protein [Phycisphaerae bacterium]
MNNATQFPQSNNTTTTCGTTIPFDAINDPGCYVCNWSGHLLRVPEDGVAAGRSPLINVIGKDQLFVTKLSDSPYIPVTKARMIACNLDIAVNF